MAESGIFEEERYSEEESSKGEIRVILRGDDLGCCHSVNRAIEKAFRNGILTTAEMIVPAPWFEEGVEVARNNPDLDIGVHLTLTSEWKFYDWRPILPRSEIPSLINEKGYFHSTVDSFLEADPEIYEVKRELEAQIKLVNERNIEVSHLSFHMGAAVANSELRDVVESLSERYGYSLSEFSGEKLWEGKTIPIYNVSPDEKKEALKDILENMGPGTWLITLHPGLNTFEMRALRDENPEGLQNIWDHRYAVTEALTDEEMKQIVERRNINLVNYEEIDFTSID